MPGSRTTLPHTALTLLLTAPLSCHPSDEDGQVSDPRGCRSVVLPAAPGVTSSTSTTEVDSTETGSTSSTAMGAPDPGSESTAGAPECTLDSDCMDSFVCLDGACTNAPNDCGDAMINLPLSSPNMVLVIDKSGSMVSNSWDADNDPNTPAVTRWYSLYTVLETFAPAFDGAINLGLQLFPSLQAKSKYDAAACVVEATPEVPVATDNGATILAALPPADAITQIAGATPLRKSLESAIAHLKSLDTSRPRFITIITDGAANCSPEGENPLDSALLFETYDDKVAEVASNAFTADNIGVFVIAINAKNEVSPTKADGNPDNTNLFERMNELAVAGGYPKSDPNEQFYNAVNQVELQDALTAIAMQILPCTHPLDPLPKYPEDVVLNVGGVNYEGPLATMSCSGDGWYFSKPDFSEFTLCGAACSDYKTSGSITAQYKCPGG